MRIQRPAVGRLARSEVPPLDLRRVFDGLLPAGEPIVDVPSPTIGKKLISLFGWEGTGFEIALLFRCAWRKSSNAKIETSLDKGGWFAFNLVIAAVGAMGREVDAIGVCIVLP